MQSRRALLAAMGLAVLMTACGGDDSGGAPDAAPPPNVGSTCNADGGCDPALTCDTTFTGGYCTKSCATPGSTAECPPGAVCDTVAAMMTCVQICDTTEDCRLGLDCNGVSGSNLKACKPTM